MTARRAISALSALALLAGACQPSPSGLPEADQAAIHQLITDVAATLQRGDHAAWAGLFAEDGVIFSPNSPPIRGRSVIQKWGAALPPVTELSFNDVTVTGNGPVAFATSGYIFATQGSPADTGKQLWAFRRAPGGRWEVVVASYSSNLPPPVGPVAMPASR